MTVPARNRGFVGREKELHEISVLCESGKIPLITGPGGVGKTELAYEFAHRYCGNYHGGCFLVPMEKVQTWQDAFRFMLDLSSADGGQVWEWLTVNTKWAGEKMVIPDKVPELLTIKSRGEKVLLILDNIDNLDLIDDVGFLEAFSYGLPEGVHAIATTRHLTREFGHESAVSIFLLENLSVDAALNLLKSKCPPRDSSEMNAARELVSLLDCHAWSVELVGSELALTYRRGASYKAKLSKLRNDTTLLGHGRSLRKNTEANAIDLLRPTLETIRLNELYGENFIKIAQIASLFPANGVATSVLQLVWNKKFAEIASEIPFRTVLSILRDYALLRTEEVTTHENDWSLEFGRRQEVSMHRFTRAGLQVSIGEDIESLISETGNILLSAKDFSIEDWIVLSDDSRLFEKCPFEKFTNKNIVELLSRHPEFVTKFNVNALPNMDRARLFSRRPELVDENSFDGLGSGALWFIAANQPKLMSRMNVGLITTEDWSFLLCYQPQYAYMCDFQRFTARDWCRLLRRRGEFADQCDFNLFSEANWTDLIEESPEFADRVDIEKFEYGNVRRILSLQPSLATRSLLRRLNWDDVEHVICGRAELLDLYDTKDMKPLQWLSLLDSNNFNKNVDVAHLCDLINFDNFSSNDFCCLVEMCYHKIYDKDFLHKSTRELLPLLDFLEQHAKKVFERLNHAQKMRVAAIFPNLFGLIGTDELLVDDWILAAWLRVDVANSLDLSILGRRDWLSLLMFRPDFSDKCDFSRFTSDDWAVLLSYNIDFIKFCDVSRLDGAFWRIFAHGKYSYDDLVCSRPSFCDEYDFSQLDRFLTSQINGTYHDSDVEIGYAYDLFAREYVREFWWYKKRILALEYPIHKAMGGAELYARACRCLGPYFPEKFNFAFIADRIAIRRVAKALLNREDGHEILEKIDWALVDIETRDEWKEACPDDEEFFSTLPPYNEAMIPKGWQKWRDDYWKSSHEDEIYIPNQQYLNP